MVRDVREYTLEWNGARRGTFRCFQNVLCSLATRIVVRPAHKARRGANGTLKPRSGTSLDSVQAPKQM